MFVEQTIARYVASLSWQLHSENHLLSEGKKQTTSIKYRGENNVWCEKCGGEEGGEVDWWHKIYISAWRGMM